MVGFFLGRITLPKDEGEKPVKEKVTLESGGWNPISFKPTNEDSDTLTYFEKSRMGDKIAIASYPEFPGHSNGVIRVGKITKETDGWKVKLHVSMDGEEISEIEVASNPMLPVSIPQPPWAKAKIPVLIELAEVNNDVAEFFVIFNKE